MYGNDSNGYGYNGSGVSRQQYQAATHINTNPNSNGGYVIQNLRGPNVPLIVTSVLGAPIVVGGGLYYLHSKYAGGGGGVSVATSPHNVVVVDDPSFSPRTYNTAHAVFTPEAAAGATAGHFPTMNDIHLTDAAEIARAGLHLA